MNLFHEQLREALAAYIHTIPSRERLIEHISSHGLSDIGSEIEVELVATLRTAETYLFDYPDGVPWTPAFETTYFTHMATSHPWIDDQAMSVIRSFSGWLCWHEGLNAPTARI